MLADCLSVLSVTFVHCGQTVGWIKMPPGVEVGLGPGHIVLDGDLASPKGTHTPIFGPCLLWPNGWMDQDAIWYGGGTRPRQYFTQLIPLVSQPYYQLSKLCPLTVPSSRHCALLPSPDFHAVIVVHGSYAVHHFTY